MGTPRSAWLALLVAAHIAPFGALGADDFGTCREETRDLFEWALPVWGEEVALAIGTNVFNPCMQEPE